MEQRTVKICGIVSVIVIGIVLIAGNLRVTTDEAFTHVGSVTTWTCRECGSKLEYEPTYLAQQLRLIRAKDDAPEPHRWVFNYGPEHLTPRNPFHWLAIYQFGLADRSEIGRARQDARADNLIKEFGSRISFKSKNVGGSKVP